MSRFDDRAYTGLLKRILDPRCNGISYIERVWVATGSRGEIRAWRTSSPTIAIIFCVLLVAFIALIFDAAFGNGPRGLVPLIPMAGILMLGPVLELTGRALRPFLLRRRARLTAGAFAEAAGMDASVEPGLVDAVRAALGRIYGIPYDAVLPWDSCRTLRRFVGGGVPYAFEVVLGARLIMDDQYCTDDPGVDDVLQEVHDTADTVADIVRIMCAAYGNRAANGGAAQSDGVGEGIG